jgi:curli biogenesis system outer membrane secretion channel CsgG
MTRRTIAHATTLALLAAAATTALRAQEEKPRIAVLEFENKADNSWWWNNGAGAAQDIFVTQLVQSGRYRVLERERLSAILQEQNLSLSGDIDPATALQLGRLAGVKYFLTGALTEYGGTNTEAHGGSIGGLPGFGGGKRTFVAAFNARLIDAETGDIVWADEGRGEDSNFRISVGGFGGGVSNDERMFDKVLKPIIQDLAQKLAAADF